MNGCVDVKYGPLAGHAFGPVPYRLESINDQKDAEVVVSVGSYIVMKILSGPCKYLEVDGYDPDNKCWVVSAYQITEEVPAVKLASMVDEFAKYTELRNSIVKIQSLPDEWSKGNFKGETVRGCLRVYICNPKTRSSSSELMTSKPLVHEDAYLISAKDNYLTSAKNRSDKYMRSGRSGIGKGDSYKPSLSEVSVSVSEKRGLVSRFLEYIAGVSPQDIDQTVKDTFAQNV